MKLAILNSYSFHYEMYGYLIEFCDRYKINYNIYTNEINNFGYLDLYNGFFGLKNKIFNIMSLKNTKLL
jgi:hypothetical protein